MHSWHARASMLMSAALTALLAAAVLMNLMPRSAKFDGIVKHRDLEDVRLASLQVNRRHKADVAELRFDLDVDLTPLFDWTTKQVFVFLVAEYEANDQEQRVVVWDKIVQRNEDYHLQLRQQRGKYPLVDWHKDLRDQDVRFRIGWDIHPTAGSLAVSANTESLQGSLLLHTPDDYFKKQRRKRTRSSSK
ncbi:MAG: hypothetical protein MHM6MM_007032 [Cercozoa sp. M6MM]